MANENKPAAPAAETTPVTRQRTGFLGTVNPEAQAQRQKSAVERHEAAQEANELRHLAQTTPTKLSVKGFVGKASNEPDKPDEMEDAKKGQVGNGPGVAEPFNMADHLIDQEHEGKVIDQIVLSPHLEQNGVTGAQPMTEAQKVQAVIDKATGKNAAEPSGHEAEPSGHEAELAELEKEQAGKDT